MATDSQTFRFLDLPQDIRLIVYENLPRQIKHHRLTDADTTTDRLVLIVRSVPVSILCTCKTIHEEARNIVHSIVEKFIKGSKPKLIANWHIIRFLRAHMVFYDLLKQRDVAKITCDQQFISFLEALFRLEEIAISAADAHQKIDKFNIQSSYQLAHHITSLAVSKQLFTMELVVLEYIGHRTGYAHNFFVCLFRKSIFNSCLGEKSMKLCCAGYLPSTVYASSSGDITERPMDGKTWKEEWIE